MLVVGLTWLGNEMHRLQTTLCRNVAKLCGKKGNSGTNMQTLHAKVLHLA